MSGAVCFLAIIESDQVSRYCGSGDVKDIPPTVLAVLSPLFFIMKYS